MKEVQLKNHHSLSLQHIKSSDAEARHAFFVELSLAQEGMVHTSDEIDFHTEESRAKIEDFLRNRRGLWLLAKNDQGEVIGEIDIIVKKLIRVMHGGQLTIGIVPAYQKLGLGSLFMQEALAWSKEQGLRRLELSVFASNRRAQALYKKFGFAVEGVRKKYLRHVDGSFEDDLLMGLTW